MPESRSAIQACHRKFRGPQMAQDDDEYSLVRRWELGSPAAAARWGSLQLAPAAVWRGAAASACGTCAAGPASSCCRDRLCPRQAPASGLASCCQGCAPCVTAAPAAAEPGALPAPPPPPPPPQPGEGSDDDFEVKLAVQQPLTQPPEVCAALCSRLLSDSACLAALYQWPATLVTSAWMSVHTAGGCCACTCAQPSSACPAGGG